MQILGLVTEKELADLAALYSYAYMEILMLMKKDMEEKQAEAAALNKINPYAEEAYAARAAALYAEHFFVDFRNYNFANFTEEEKALLKHLLETSGPARQEYFRRTVLPLIAYPEAGYYPTVEARVARDAYADALATGDQAVIDATFAAFQNEMGSGNVDTNGVSTQKTFPVGLIAAVAVAYLALK
jgi:hypothetical protein